MNLPVGSNFERAFYGTQILGDINLNGSSFRETFSNSAFSMSEANEVILTLNNSDSTDQSGFYQTFYQTKVDIDSLKVRLISPNRTLTAENTFQYNSVNTELSVTFTAPTINISTPFYNISARTLNIVFGDSRWTNRAEGEWESLIGGCYNLTTLNIDHIYDNMWLNSSSNLTQESVNNVLNALADGVTDKSITFASTQYNYITEEQKAAATAKGWTIKSA